MQLKAILIITATLLLMTVLSPSLPAQILTPDETHQLVEMLNAADLDSTDVMFLKDWDSGTKFKLSCQVEALNNPWKFLDLLDKLKFRIEILSDNLVTTRRKMLSSYIAEMSDFSSWLDIELPSSFIGRGEPDLQRAYEKIKTPRDCFNYAEVVFAKVNGYLDKGFAQLTPVEQDSLFDWMFTAWQESEDSLAYKEFFTKRFPNIKTTMSTENAIKLLEKVDLISLAQAWSLWEKGNHNLIYLVPKLKFDNAKPIYHDSKWGTMIIGGTGDDRYSDNKRLRKKPVCLILEPGGNDTYNCALYTDRQHPFYLVVDLKGNDLYSHNEIARGQSVLAGCGTLIDFEGDDVYQYSDFAFSSLLGFQYTYDMYGNDIYSSGLFSQAAAMFGISILNDQGGNDTYTATEFAQGLGGPKGLGLLLDGKGNDVYYTGGKYLHVPLAPFDYRSMAQGFGFGFRPDFAGGIGILYDGEGNDRYSGGVYAQGVAYWYAIGALFDEKGNDYYDAVYYPQGSGIHLANGALVDMEGEDHYYSKHGPGQGNGHDWSVGVFIDKKGNDQYSVEGGNGLALTNSVGIFVDSEGNDKYEYKNPNNYGYATPARETGGIGLFLDAGGKDVYADTLQANDKTWQNGTYGIGRDIELNIPEQSKMEELAEQSVTDVDSLASIETLFNIASEWEVGSAAKRVKLAREYLLKRSAEAVPFAIKMRMDTKDGLVYRTLSELATKSELMKTALYTVLHDADSLKVKNAIGLFAEIGDSLAVDSVSVFLEQKKYIPTVLSSLGYLKSSKAMGLIKPWLSHQTEKYRYIAARSLKAMNTKESLAELRKMANDKSFLIKAMVRQLPKS
jgi:hypothetical protein